MNNMNSCYWNINKISENSFQLNEEIKKVNKNLNIISEYLEKGKKINTDVFIKMMCGPSESIKMCIENNVKSIQDQIEFHKKQKVNNERLMLTLGNKFVDKKKEVMFLSRLFSDNIKVGW